MLVKKKWYSLPSVDLYDRVFIFVLDDYFSYLFIIRAYN